MFHFSPGDFDFSSAYSDCTVDGVTLKLDFAPSAEPDKWVCRNTFGTWEMTVVKSALEMEIFSRFLPAAKFESITMRQLVLPHLECDHLLISSIKMGGCRSWKMPVAQAEEFKSFYTCAITGKQGTLLITNPLQQTQYAYVTGTASDNGVIDLALTGSAGFYDGKTVEFTPVKLRFGDGFELLESYASEQKYTVRDFSTPPAPGWNSWDYYRWTITEKEVLKNAEFIARDPVLSRHIKRIIIDDGWQYCYGEWEANPLFPGGMKSLAAEIRALGFTPGLWLAPGIIEPHCRIAQLDYDMLGQSIGGQPALVYECMKRHGFVLDPTVAKSRKFLRELFDKCCNWGYEYFKLDFIEKVMNAPRFADRSVPRSRIIAKLMEPITEGVAGRAEIMGCNYPFMAGNTFVSAVRTGSDIQSDWKNIRGNSLNSAFRYWMNKRLWINDPDFALCRGVDTTDAREKLAPMLIGVEAQSKYNDFYTKTFCSTTLSEQQILLSLVLMTGGAVNLSDDLTLLNAAGLDLARKVVSAESGAAAVPLDLFRASYPQFYLQKLAHGGRLLVINWADQEQEIVLPPELNGILPESAVDFWSGKTSRITSSLVLAPHSCRLWQW